MSEYKLTDWFSPEIKPTIIGWYQRNYGDCYCCNDWWDGNQFIVVENETGKHVGPAKNKLCWRGLAEDPNKKEEA